MLCTILDDIVDLTSENADDDDDDDDDTYVDAYGNNKKDDRNFIA